ncbi:MAG TPA: hypothetical protein VJJ77_00735 [Dongiaceae bacterium]|nr:hypothetical protein [Dongiaceae bacterium]
MADHPASPKALREKRLAEALRLNLKRRKAAAKARPPEKPKGSAGDKDSRARS